jgi:hypothetical protein
MAAEYIELAIAERPDSVNHGTVIRRARARVN